MQPSQSELEAFLFGVPDAPLQKSQLPSKFPNQSNKTGEDLQELIEEIPYPTEDLSLTSFSNSSSNTNALKRPKPVQKGFYTSFGSEINDQKTPIQIKFERYQSKQQKDESFDDEDDLSNLPNFESLTPHRINQIMDWSKQHVTPGDSKHIFPQVIAPSIEFSHETSAYLSKCVLTEQNEFAANDLMESQKERSPRQKEKNHKENKRPIGFIQENGNEYQKPANLLKKFEEKKIMKEDRSHRMEKALKLEEKNSKSQTSYQRVEDRSQRMAEISQRLDDKSQIFEEKIQKLEFEDKIQRFEERSQKKEPKILEEKPQITQFIFEKFQEKPTAFQEKSTVFQESAERIDLERLKMFCQRLESQCQAKDNLLLKKDQETFTLITKIKDLEEELSLLRESTQEGSNLELLRGKNLESARKDARLLRKDLEQKQSFINDLMNQIENYKQNEFALQESVEKELAFLTSEIEKNKALTQTYKRKAVEVENQLKQTLDQREIDNTEYERKVEAISQGFEEISAENDALKHEKQGLTQELESLKKKTKGNETEIDALREQNRLLKEKEELMYQGENTSELLQEKTSLQKDLHEEIERLRKAHEKATKELEEYRSNNPPLIDENTRVSINKLMLTEQSFGKNESKGLILPPHCDHRSLLETFFLNIGFREEGSESLEGKSFEELINLLHSIFNHLQDQFETLYNERNEMADSLAKFMEKAENEDNGHGESENEKEILRNELKAKKEENVKIQEILNIKISENMGLNEGLAKLREELTRKNESLEIFETRQRVENPEILVRNSETFQVLAQKYEEGNKKYNELSKNYQDLLQKLDEFSRKDQDSKRKTAEFSASYEEISSKYNELSSKYNEVSLKYNDTLQKYNEIISKNNEISLKNNEISSKYNEISSKYNEISSKYNESKKEIDSLRREKALISEVLEQKNHENELKSTDLKISLETIENQKFLLNSLQSEKIQIIENLQSQINFHKMENKALKSDNSLLESEISRLKAEIANEKTVSESHRMSALDFSKRLEILTRENEDLKELLSQQGEKIEELTKLIDQDLESKGKLEDLQLDAKEFSEKLMEEIEALRREINEYESITDNLKTEKERLAAEIQEIREKNDELDCENLRLKQDLASKNERLRNTEENMNILKEKDKKNIQLFKENKSLADNLRALEESSSKDRQELERKSKLLAQKTQDIKNLAQTIKEKTEELQEEKRKSESFKLQLEEYMKPQNEKNEKKVVMKENSKDKENMLKLSNKLKQNDEELKEIKKMFLSEKEKLLHKMREMENIKEKTSKENAFLKESNQMAKERILLLERTMRDEDLKKTQKISSSFWCPEMLSNEETVEMMLELLRKIIGSSVILGQLNENAEMIILLKRMLKNFSGNKSQDMSHITYFKI